MDQDAVNFFKKKKSWSRYKDLILDYYLSPYLAKISHLKKPILIVDCFAGPGKFEDGEIGSPLIISSHLNKYFEKGVEVKGYFIEKNDDLFSKLESNIGNNVFPTIVRKGSFQNYINELSEYAKTHTVFVYVDPIKPSQLSFEDLKSVYEQLEKSNQSIETLINFMSFGFLRAIEGIKECIIDEKGVKAGHSGTLKWNSIAGGNYWQEILFCDKPPMKKVEFLASGYTKELHRWFRYVLDYPVREKYEDTLPKYHLIFGSRHPDAVELINRAMVKARREFVGSRFVKGMLFDNRPPKEVVNEDEIKDFLLSVLNNIKKSTWKMLRVNTTLAYPCMYTDSEFDRNIKKLIQKKIIKSDSDGNRIENDAKIWIN